MIQIKNYELQNQRAETNSAHIHFAELLSGSSRNEKAIQIEKGSHVETEIGDIVVFGDKPSTVAKKVKLQHTSGDPIEVLGLESSCGCTSVEVDKKHLSKGQTAIVSFAIDVNPAHSVPEKGISIRVHFDNGGTLSIRTVVRAFPSVFVADSLQSGRSRLDGGDLFVEIDRKTGAFTKEIGICSVTDDVSKLTSAQQPKIKRLFPVDFRSKLVAKGEPELIKQTGGSDKELYRQEFALQLVGALSSKMPQQVEIEFGNAISGGPTLTFCLQQACALSVDRSTLLLSKSRKSVFITLTRNDGQRLDVAEIDHDKSVVVIEELSSRTNHSIDYRVEMNSSPSKPLEKTVVMFRTADHEEVGISVVCLGSTSTEEE